MLFGNNLEMVEAINSLKGNMPSDVEGVVVNLALQIMKLAGYNDISRNKIQILDIIKSGKALEKFKELVKLQGGDISYIDNPEKFEKAPIITPIISETNGYIEELDAEIVGKVCLNLGAGRRNKEDVIDNRVGVILTRKIGDKIEKGEVIGYIHSNDINKTETAMEMMKNAYKIGTKIKQKKNILDII